MSGLVEASRYTTRVEADLARLYLENEGVEAVLFDDGINSMHILGVLAPIRLMVLDEDLAAARRVLGKYKS